MKKTSILLLSLSLVLACSSDDDYTQPNNIVTKADVVSNYADVVYQSYSDSYTTAITMQTAINAFVNDPTDARFTTAKSTWLAAREPYGQTEAYRGATGPIDTDGNPWSLNTEGQMNAWPIDEAYIDYVEAGSEAWAGTYTSSIIADASITIDASTLADLNEAGGSNEKAVSTGWHAIEFLLWGQDQTFPEAELAGQREFTDYTTASDADRRGQYLQVVTNLLVSDLNDLVNTWTVGGTYRTVFEGLDEDVALSQAIQGAFFISGDELSEERMVVPVDNTEGIGGLGQELEHSCFADNTNRDVYNNAKGVINVIFGSYSTTNGASFYDLVLLENPTQANSLKAAAEEVLARVNIVGVNSKPFDLLIAQESTNPITGPVMESVVALRDLADEISASATLIGLTVN